MNLAIHHTVTPEGQVIRHMYGMKPPVVRCMRGIMKTAIKNKIRKGGICYQDLPLVEQSKKIISR